AAAADGDLCAFIAQYEAVAAKQRDGRAQHHLAVSLFARRQRLALVEQYELAENLRRARIDTHGLVTLDRPSGGRADLHPRIEPFRRACEPRTPPATAALSVRAPR